VNLTDGPFAMHVDPDDDELEQIASVERRIIEHAADMPTPASRLECILYGELVGRLARGTRSFQNEGGCDGSEAMLRTVDAYARALISWASGLLPPQAMDGFLPVLAGMMAERMHEGQEKHRKVMAEMERAS
jgi:hypothetical protein